MTWTYTPDFTTTRDKVRVEVGDTDSTDPQLTDEEIAYKATTETGIYNIAAACAEAIAAKYARRVNMSVDRASKSASDLYAHYKDLAVKLRTKALTVTGVAPFAGGISIASKETYEGDTDRVSPAFTKDLFIHPGTVDGDDDEDSE